MGRSFGVTILFTAFLLLSISCCAEQNNEQHNKLLNHPASSKDKVEGSAPAQSLIRALNNDQAGQAPLPKVDDEAVTKSLSWIVDTLDLRRHGYKYFQIKNYAISQDKQYVIANIRDGKLGAKPGPLRRFLIYNPTAKRIFFPTSDVLLSDNLGYGYIAAVFGEYDMIAVAYGYRSITASVVSLPEGKVLNSRELDPFDYSEVPAIESVLKEMLEKQQ